MTCVKVEHPNFFRRYKWAFELDYATSFEMSPVAHPDIQQYLRACHEVWRNADDHESVNCSPEGGGSSVEDIQTINPESIGNFQHPAELVALAKSIGEEMLQKNDHGAWAGVWARERVEVKVINLSELSHIFMIIFPSSSSVSSVAYVPISLLSPKRATT